MQSVLHCSLLEDVTSYLHQGVRGVATGFIVAFDKHWNLAMKDVEEQFTRRRASKVPRTVKYCFIQFNHRHIQHHNKFMSLSFLYRCLPLAKKSRRLKTRTVNKVERGEGEKKKMERVS